MDLSNNIVSKTIIDCSSNPYRFKDARKFEDITKFIGRGSEESSSNKYAKALSPIANTGKYVSTDIVGISVEGLRKNRIPFDENEVLLAIKAGATIITDRQSDRERVYNIGEKELADFLYHNAYTEWNGIWKPFGR